jgi:hypothetical protein
MPIGSLIQQAREDTLEYIQGDFSVELTLQTNYTGVTFVEGLEIPYVDLNRILYTGLVPENPNEITVQGLATRHSQTYDPDTGIPIIGQNNHICFSENDLNNLGYATRNIQGDCIVKNWIVSWSDSISNTNTYKIEEPEPDETLGLIKCMIGKYGSD